MQKGGRATTKVCLGDIFFFRNTIGGTILLGISEHLLEAEPEKRFEFTGVANPQKMKKEFFDILNSNKVIDVTEELDQETVLKLNILLNSVLNGLSIEEINLGMIQNLKEQAGIHSELVASVIDAVAEVIHAEDEVKIYTSGATNIFRYPELSDNGKASEIISTFEEKQELTDLVNQTLENSESKGIQVYIGQETPIQAMKDCSVVTATYELGGGLQGTIGIIGPKRMDYENVLKTLKTLTEQLDRIYNKEQK